MSAIKTVVLVRLKKLTRPEKSHKTLPRVFPLLGITTGLTTVMALNQRL